MHRIKVDVAIIGAGVGGLMCARELLKKGKRVLILEKGGAFRQEDAGKKWRVIARYYEKFAMQRSLEGVFIYRTSNFGGSSVVACSNMIRGMEKEFASYGINLGPYFDELEEEFNISAREEMIVGKARLLRESAQRLGLKMEAMPKAYNKGANCDLCGKCVFGCHKRAKWTMNDFFCHSYQGNPFVFLRSSLQKIVFDSQQNVNALIFKQYDKKYFVECESVVISAGALSTPIILQRHNISAGHNLFIDPFVVAYAVSDKDFPLKGQAMSAVLDRREEGFIISPFIDDFWQRIIFNDWKWIFSCGLNEKRLFGLMIKIADENKGAVYSEGVISKKLSHKDLLKIQKGILLAENIFKEAGFDSKKFSFFQRYYRGAHPGGTASIGKVVDKNLKVLGCSNLYVCDASVLPFSPGLPPILIICSLAKYFVNKNF